MATDQLRQQSPPRPPGDAQEGRAEGLADPLPQLVVAVARLAYQEVVDVGTAFAHGLHLALLIAAGLAAAAIVVAALLRGRDRTARGTPAVA